VTADLQRIAEATDIGALVASYGVKLNRIAGGFTAQCCFHSEKSASLRIHTAGKRRGKFKCFGCDAKGDVYDFVQRIESVSLPEAVRRLAYDAGIPLDNRPETPQERAQRLREREEREMCQWWYRERWKDARRGLNRAMELNPWIQTTPIAWDMKTGTQSGGEVTLDLAGQLAELYGARLRWIEANRSTTAGLTAFRAARVPHRLYREHLKRAENLRAAQTAFLEFVFQSLEAVDSRSSSKTQSQSGCESATTGHK
jgi:CHC2-type zinc finger protein